MIESYSFLKLLNSNVAVLSSKISQLIDNDRKLQKPITSSSVLEVEAFTLISEFKSPLCISVRTEMFMKLNAVRQHKDFFQSK